MNDNDIIKALECCSRNGTSNTYCCDCSYEDYEDCGARQSKDALDLINRQQAEIERLNKELKKIKSDLKWYLDTNEENGVVYIPEFTVRKITEVSK